MSLLTFQERILPMKDKLFRLAFGLVRQREEAEDIVQEVMVRIWNKRGDWPGFHNLEGYCMIMARNLSLDRVRSRKLITEELDGAQTLSSPEQDPLQLAERKELMKRIRECIRNLPEKQQLVLQLREIEGRSYQEISDQLEISLDQVRVNLFRARNSLKNQLVKQEHPWNTMK